MLKYEEYILENKIAELLLEGVMKYKPDFWHILIILRDEGNKIATELLKLENQEVNSIQNNISLTDKNDMIKFIPENKKTGKFVVNASNRGNFLTDLRYYHALGLTYDVREKPEFEYVPNAKSNITPGTSGVINKEVEFDDKILVFFFSAGKSGVCFKTNLDELLPPGSEIGLGRFVNKLLTTAGVSFTDKDIEEFVNGFKAQFEIKVNKVYENFKIVSGEEIRKYYLENNYSTKSIRGPLFNSCMRYAKCQPFLDMYVENPDKIQLVVLMNDDKIKGRAILWKLDSPDKFFMDRIYWVDDSDVNLFIDYAKKNEWIYKSHQDREQGHIIGSIYRLKCKLKNYAFDHYPYMDTLSYMSDNGDLCNISDDARELSDRRFFKFRDTEGRKSVYDK